jgi:hypothetical protein
VALFLGIRSGPVQRFIELKPATARMISVIWASSWCLRSASMSAPAIACGSKVSFLAKAKAARLGSSNSDQSPSRAAI